MEERKKWFSLLIFLRESLEIDEYFNIERKEKIIIKCKMELNNMFSFFILLLINDRILNF